MNCFVIIKKKYIITKAKKREVIKGRENTKSRILLIRKIYVKDSKTFQKAPLKILNSTYSIWILQSFLNLRI